MRFIGNHRITSLFQIVNVFNLTLNIGVSLVGLNDNRLCGFDCIGQFLRFGAIAFFVIDASDYPIGMFKLVDGVL